MIALGVFTSAGRSTSPDVLSLLANPIIWSIIGFGAGIYLFFRGFAILRRKRFLENVPQCTIRGASLGLVEISGKVEGPYTIIAPLSEEDCFYYRTIAWTGGERNWRKAAEESLSAPFFLDDGTGKVMVDARGAQSELDAVFSEEYQGTVPDFAQHFLNRHGVSSRAAIKLQEYIARHNEAMFAVGVLRENTEKDASAPGPFLSAEAAELQREQELGGVILPRAAAARPQPSDRTVSSQFDLHPKVVLGSGPGRRLFISGRSQRQIVQDFAWKSALYIWGGPLLTLFCFWYLLSRLGYL